jgi:hypothetical protein
MRAGKTEEWGMSTNNNQFRNRIQCNKISFQCIPTLNLKLWHFSMRFILSFRFLKLLKDPEEVWLFFAAEKGPPFGLLSFLSPKK